MEAGTNDNARLFRDGFSGQRILIVGGAGFVGSNLCQALLHCAPRSVLIVDNLLSADISNVPRANNVEFVLGPATSDRVLAALPTNLDYVFHLATYHGNQSSLHDPLADHEHNTLTTLKLLERIKDISGLKGMVYASAGCTVAAKTFDAANATTEDEPVTLYLDSPYQISKVIGELYGNYYSLRYDVPFIKARFQNVYGPREILGAGQWRGTPATVWRNVTPTFIYRALKHEALPLENNGIATRDFIYVDDIVDGLMRCALHGDPGEVYNLASGRETSIRQLAETINRLAENPTPVETQPARDWDRSGKRYGSPEKARQYLGFSADTPLEEGLHRTIAWAKANMETIERCIAQHEYFMQRSLSRD